MKEIWKNIAGFEGKYMVSDLGNITSLNYRKTGSAQILKPSFNGKYLMVCLQSGRIPKRVLVHRVVAEAFHANPENKPTVNHGDLNKLNNRADNLSWATRVEQMAHVNRLRPIKVAKGFDLPHTKISDSDAEKMFNLWDGGTHSQPSIAKIFGVSQSVVSRRILRHIKEHGWG